MPLRRQHLGHVPLHLFADLAGFVEAVDEDERAARRHGLAQHAVVRCLGAELEAEESVDPVPGRRKRVARVEQASLYPLRLDQGGVFFFNKISSTLQNCYRNNAAENGNWKGNLMYPPMT